MISKTFEIIHGCHALLWVQFRCLLNTSVCILVDTTIAAVKSQYIVESHDNQLCLVKNRHGTPSLEMDVCHMIDLKRFSGISYERYSSIWDSSGLAEPQVASTESRDWRLACDQLKTASRCIICQLFELGTASSGPLSSHPVNAIHRSPNVSAIVHR